MIRLLYVLFVSFQVINRMRCFQFIKLETARLTNNKRDIVQIISVCGYIFRKLIVHCLISYREGLGTSLLIIILATIDPHSQKEHTEIHKIPKFGVNQASFD